MRPPNANVLPPVSPVVAAMRSTPPPFPRSAAQLGDLKYGDARGEGRPSGIVPRRISQPELNVNGAPPPMPTVPTVPTVRRVPSPIGQPVRAVATEEVDLELAASLRGDSRYRTPSEPTMRVPPLNFTSAGALLEANRDDTERHATVPAAPSKAHASKPLEAQEWQSLVRSPGEGTQRRVARDVVPDLRYVDMPSKPIAEGSEHGLVPSGELERTLSDMAVLFRYGHVEQVRTALEKLCATFPEDLLLLRRVAEFYVSQDARKLALDPMFTLATKMFEQRNVEGMRQALQQVRMIEPGNERALKLLALLEQRG